MIVNIDRGWMELIYGHMPCLASFPSDPAAGQGSVGLHAIPLLPAGSQLTVQQNMQLVSHYQKRAKHHGCYCLTNAYTANNGCHYKRALTL